VSVHYIVWEFQLSIIYSGVFFFSYTKAILEQYKYSLYSKWNVAIAKTQYLILKFCSSR